MPNAVLDQIRRLDEQKEKLLQDAKQEALAKANAAIGELNELGFNYRIVEGTAPSRSASTGTRRSGIRDDVLRIVKAAGQGGITVSTIRQKLNVASSDKSGSQSVANAVSALKRTGKITDNSGSYVAA